MAATIVLRPINTGKMPIFDFTPYAAMTILRARLVPNVLKRTGDGMNRAQDVTFGGKKLSWAGPRYLTLDCTDIVRAGGKIQFDCNQLTAWNGQPTVELTVAELMGDENAPKVASLRAGYQDGQVFLLWSDAVDPAVPVLPDVCTPSEYLNALALIRNNPRKIRYRIYRSKTRDIRDAELLDEIGLLSAWAPERWGWNGIDKDRRAPKPGEYVPRYYLPTANQLTRPTESIYVDTVTNAEPETWYYGVAVVVNGQENLDAIAWASSVTCRAAEPEYHWQFVKGETNYGGIPRVEVDYYIRWESPKTETSNMPSEPCWYSVALPANRAPLAPATMCFHPWGGMVGDPGQPPQQLPSRHPVVLTTGQRPDVYDFYTGYNEAFRTNMSYGWKPWRSYTYNRCRQFMDWAIPRYHIDPEQIGVHGGSMGGTGSMMQAVFNPKVAWCHTRVGNFDPFDYAVPATPGRTSPGNRVRDLWGPPGEWQNEVVCFLDGRYHTYDPYHACDLVTWANVAETLPYIVMGFGVNDTAIPVEQHWRMMFALDDGRHPYAASWDSKGHAALAWWPSTGTIKSNDSDLVPKLSESMPAFLRCSLNSPHTSTEGQHNRWLCWGNVTCTEQEWSCDVWLNPQAPAESCRVVVSPARTRGLWSGQSQEVTVAKQKVRVTFSRDMFAKAAVAEQSEESQEDDMTLVYLYGENCAKSIFRDQLADALGRPRGENLATLFSLVQQQTNELSRLRVAVAHQQQELLISRQRDDVE